MDKPLLAPAPPPEEEKKDAKPSYLNDFQINKSNDLSESLIDSEEAPEAPIIA